ncbi:juvenile hormone esterase-like [Halyomorpha halys]|uniref:juvenile hormone esterase-like n=1 Tax=Halyomorpha halys TaxID=286706 RepID=UPI0034D2C25F
MYMPQISLLLLYAITAFADDGPIVDTTAGAVRGFTSRSRSGRQFLSYKGIPFARPPLGKLRFKPPEEPQPWAGIRNATEDGPFCIQYNMFQLNPQVIGSEDCLHLSVFTHDTNGSAPVLVHIHGGGFIAGDKSKISPIYFMDHDVVVVGINYRLGIMGFLSFEDQEQPGNQGMKDQVMALRWVKKNIAKFGGDPNRVTLVGESAGGASVIHHVISPLSRGLFHGAIAESGSSYNIWTILPPGLARNRASNLTSLASCRFNSTREIVTCLQEMNATELVGLMEHFREWQIDPLMLLFQPVLESKGSEAFLTGPISSWEHSPVPLLIGMTSGEGLLRSRYFLEYNMDFKWYNDNFEKVAPISYQYVSSASNPDEVTRKIKQYYFGNKEITAADWLNITLAYSDSWFTAGILDAANKHTGDVYFYYFDYIGEYSYTPKNKTLAIGAGHSEEILYIWFKTFAPDLKGSDLELSIKLVEIWTNFVKYGKPVSPESNRLWPTWTSKKHRYMHISKSGFQIKEGLLENRYSFWSSLNYKDKYEQTYQ